jgi:hypothetical protein
MRAVTAIIVHSGMLLLGVLLLPDDLTSVIRVVGR